MGSKASKEKIRNRILVVDDDSLIQFLYREFFRAHSNEFIYHWEMSGENALLYLKQRRVDAVILDWNLPGIDGIETLQAIRSHSERGGVPVMFVTGRVGAVNKTLALKYGANEYLSKPVPKKELLTHLRNLLRN